MKKLLKCLADAIGVEMGEEFDIVDNTGSPTLLHNPFHFTETRLADCDGNEAGPHIVFHLVYGEFEAVKLPYRPTRGGGFWFVHLDGCVMHSSFTPTNLFDILLLRTGNCFKTKEDAEVERDRILKEMRGFYDGFQ